MDDERGLATDTGIPWHIPADVAHFREMTASSKVLMGYATYTEFDGPMPGRTNYVATRRTTTLREGFIPVGDLPSFLAEQAADDLWVIGGAVVYTVTLDATEELELTRVHGNFGCTKFFPAFEDSFVLITDEAMPDEPDVPRIRFQTWRRR
jgi:dihydrofolate reductase